MLDFFEQQARARRRTTLLVALYLVGVCVFVAVVSPVLMAFALLMATAFTGSGRHGHVDRQATDAWGHLAEQFFTSPLDTFHSPEGRLLWVLAAGGTVALVFGASTWKVMLLRTGGGRVVAESLGGRLVVSGAKDFYDQRLLNVVEEMAIAASVPVPPVYVLDDERAVNAFAAGYTSSDAVVTVTRGAARSLTREQLQGVVAHEFSHVLNGDMRMNIRLIGLLYGIIAVQILGKVFFNIARATGNSRGRDSGKAAALFFVFGLILLALGLTGALVARIVKAAIGREREYLADASAAQFTRNPGGLASALRVVGGSDDGGVIEASQAEEYSHLYFVGGVAGWFAGLTDSHPPLPNRIRRLDPSWDGSWLRGELERDEDDRPAPGGAPRGRFVGGAMGVAALAGGGGGGGAAVRELPSIPLADATAHVGGLSPEEVFARVGSARKILGTLPPSLLAAARDPHDARALLLAMLLDSRDGKRPAQIEVIAGQLDRATADAASRLDDVLRGLGAGVRLPLLDVAMSALASLSPEQYTQFRGALDAEIGAVGKTNLFQVCVQRLLMVHLDRKFGMAAPARVQYYALTRLGEECSLLLSAAAMVAGQDAVRAAAMVTEACKRLGTERGRVVDGREITAVRLQGALGVLATSAPRLRVQIVRECAEIFGDDGKVTPTEAELLRAVADGLDVPLAIPAGA